jgi:hypothetical protein
LTPATVFGTSGLLIIAVTLLLAGGGMVAAPLLLRQAPAAAARQPDESPALAQAIQPEGVSLARQATSQSNDDPPARTGHGGEGVEKQSDQQREPVPPVVASVVQPNLPANAAPRVVANAPASDAEKQNRDRDDRQQEERERKERARKERAEEEQKQKDREEKQAGPTKTACRAGGKALPPPPALTRKEDSKGEKETFGTAVGFVRNPEEAGRLAGKQRKLMLVLHVSGNFEDPRFT